MNDGLSVRESMKTATAQLPAHFPVSASCAETLDFPLNQLSTVSVTLTLIVGGWPVLPKEE
jgi:hypothetical protein